MAEKRVDGALRESNGLNELLARARADDETAFEELLKRYAGMVAAMVVRLGNGLSDSDVEELQQEAMISFCSAVRNFDPGQSQVTFGLYAKICVRNELLTRLRTLKKRLGQTVLPFDEIPEGEEDPTLGPDEKEKLAELQKRINEALSPYERRVFWLYVERFSAEEIAAKVGGERKSVENAIYRIRRKLRARL